MEDIEIKKQNEESIAECIMNSFQDIDKKQRHISFETCYNYFQTHRYNLIGDNLETSCLQLFAYLSHRRLTSITPVELKTLIEYFDNIKDSKIWGIDVDNYTQEDNLKIVCGVYNEIKAILTDSVTSSPRQYRPSTTLITLIMLGVFGCIPSVGTCFGEVIGFSEDYSLEEINERVLKGIALFYSKNASAFNNIEIKAIGFDGEETNRLYPKAKLLDIFCSEEGVKMYRKWLKGKNNIMQDCHLRYGCSLRFEYDDEVQKPNQREFLESLTTEQVQKEPLPLRLLLWNSVYYPASGLDGGVIKYCNTIGREIGVCSFVYCDYNAKEDELCDNVANHFRGYAIFAHRSISVGELGVKRLSMEPIDDRAKHKHLTPEGEPFCHWFIMERGSAFGDEHGPKRFSLLFLCCEGVTAYVQLYSQNEILPKALAIIQPGTGFGGNWTDFRDYNAPLSFVLRHIPYMPRYIFNGGMENSEEDYTHLPWDEYAIEDKVANYYGPGDGRMVVFKRGRR